MNRDFIFRTTGGKDNSNCLGYVLNVGSTDELLKVIKELDFKTEDLEYKRIPLSSKAVAVCLPFRTTSCSKDDHFISANLLTNGLFEEEDEIQRDLERIFHRLDTSG
jgi:hypothetical protein